MTINAISTLNLTPQAGAVGTNEQPLNPEVAAFVKMKDHMHELTKVFKKNSPNKPKFNFVAVKDFFNEIINKIVQFIKNLFSSLFNKKTAKEIQLPDVVPPTMTTTKKDPENVNPQATSPVVEVATRQERLGTLQDKTAALAGSAAEFLELCKQLPK